MRLVAGEQQVDIVRRHRALAAQITQEAAVDGEFEAGGLHPAQQCPPLLHLQPRGFLAADQRVFVGAVAWAGRACRRIGRPVVDQHALFVQHEALAEQPGDIPGQRHETPAQREVLRHHDAPAAGFEQIVHAEEDVAQTLQVRFVAVRRVELPGRGLAAAAAEIGNIGQAQREAARCGKAGICARKLAGLFTGPAAGCTRRPADRNGLAQRGTDFRPRQAAGQHRVIAGLRAGPCQPRPRQFDAPGIEFDAGRPHAGLLRRQQRRGKAAEGIDDPAVRRGMAGNERPHLLDPAAVAGLPAVGLAQVVGQALPRIFPAQVQPAIDRHRASTGRDDRAASRRTGGRWHGTPTCTPRRSPRARAG